MNYKEFKNFFDTYQKICEDLYELGDMGFDFFGGKYELSNNVGNLFDDWMQSHYTEEGCEWIDWFVFENDFGTAGLKAFDDEKPICQDLKGLYNYVKQYKK